MKESAQFGADKDGIVSGAGILVIDDESVIRATFKYLLEAAGYRVWVAEDGSEGLRIYHSEHPDLVITDLVMPNQDGLFTIRSLREESPNLPIIAMSGHTDPENADRPVESGAFCYISKPVDMDVLFGLIHDIIASGDGRAKDAVGSE